MGLLNWSRDQFGNVNKEVNRLRTQIDKVRKGVISSESKLKELNLKKELEVMLARENTMWQQRAKAHWMSDGDKNTRFFSRLCLEERKCE